MREPARAASNTGHSVPWVAEAWGVNPRTIYREVARGNLKCVRIGRVIRITDEQMAKYLASREA